MRLELAGSITHVASTILSFESDDSFDVAAYLDLGYTHFDVICIGGGGGRGGGVDTQNTGTLIRNYGGEGGGGGYHRVQGLLEGLPNTCPIVIGVAGIPGTNQASNQDLTTDGGDGGYSTFNGTTCQASGGKGGKRAQSNSATVATVANGGAGGIGNRTTAGGGAVGGICGLPGADPSTSTDGADGPIGNNVGWGGGGGAGGIAAYNGTSYLEATAGGRGSYNPDDVIVAGDGEDPQQDPGTGVDSIKPGRGGGANASPLNGLPYNYGEAGTPGIVVIRLSTR
jgi:hypothetical protein